MKTRNISESQLESALEAVNQLFDNNVTMQITCKFTSSGAPLLSVKLGVVDSRAKGGRYNPNSNRYIAAACWHVFGEFLDQLEEICNDDGIVVLSNPKTFKDDPVHPKDHGWRDWNIGSIYQRLMFSESCEC